MPPKPRADNAHDEAETESEAPATTKTPTPDPAPASEENAPEPAPPHVHTETPPATPPPPSAIHSEVTVGITKIWIKGHSVYAQNSRQPPDLVRKVLALLLDGHNGPEEYIWSVDCESTAAAQGRYGKLKDELQQAYAHPG